MGRQLWERHPANPALHMPEPLSTTRAATSSSHILIGLKISHGWKVYTVESLVEESPC